MDTIESRVTIDTLTNAVATLEDPYVDSRSSEAEAANVTLVNGADVMPSLEGKIPYDRMIGGIGHLH